MRSAAAIGPIAESIRWPRGGFRSPEALAFHGALCEKFDLSYTTGSVLSGYLSTVRIIIHMLAGPDRFLTDNSEDARETSSAAVRIRTAAAIPAG